MESKLNIDEIANLNELPLAQMLECPIDGMVSLTPVICKKCETVFCNDCVQQWKKKSSDCPMRCKPMEIIDYDKTILKHQIDLIRLKCPNEINGCKEKILWKDLEIHKNFCIYQSEKCEKCENDLSFITKISHLVENCQKNQLKCIYCPNSINLKQYTIHVNDCFKKNFDLFCKFCLKKHLNKDENCLKIINCVDCKLPDLHCDIIKKIHKCLFDQSGEKLSQYLRSLQNKFSNIQQESTKEIKLSSDSIAKKYKEIIEEIEKKNNDKKISLEKKKILMDEKYLNKINEGKMKLKDKILILEKENDDLQQNFRNYDMESNSLDENYQKYTKKIDSEYELIYWKKLNDLEHLSNQLYNLKRTEEQNGTETESKINEMKVVIPKDSIKQISASIVKQKNCQICNKDKIELTACDKCKHWTCSNCKFNCNNKLNHDSNTKSQCNNCILKCTLCENPNICISCLKKCFFKSCDNYFCNVCYTRNQHQIRSESTNCKFYSCDACKSNSNCIFTTVYCSSCDRRICKICFNKDHKVHSIKKLGVN